jgi:hypothetical protein
VYRQPTTRAGDPAWVGGHGHRDEVKAFLSSRRARITPERAGSTSWNRNRRVPGLRRSEVADLAGFRVEYYAQLERGNLAGTADDDALRLLSSWAATRRTDVTTPRSNPA